MSGCLHLTSHPSPSSAPPSSSSSSSFPSSVPPPSLSLLIDSSSSSMLRKKLLCKDSLRLCWGNLSSSTHASWRLKTWVNLLQDCSGIFLLLLLVLLLLLLVLLLVSLLLLLLLLVLLQLSLLLTSERGRWNVLDRGSSSWSVFLSASSVLCRWVLSDLLYQSIKELISWSIQVSSYLARCSDTQENCLS